MIVMSCANGALKETSPLSDEMEPLFVNTPEPELKLTEFAACINGAGAEASAGKALVIVPPAVAVKLPELVIVPWLTMSFKAFKFRCKLLMPFTPPVVGITEVNSPPACT